MIATWTRRAVLLASATALSFLAGCGSSTIESALVPTRIISFGDNFSDIGQQNGMAYTVNAVNTDGTVNTWLEQVAKDYALSIKPSSAGGTAYGRGLARVSANTNAAGQVGTLSVKQQIDAFLAKDKFASSDLVFINGGANDIVAEMNAVLAGTQTQAQMLSNVKQAGTDLATQVMRLVSSGANYVVVMGTHNLGQTPWAKAINQATVLTDMSTKFNESMLVPIVAQGKHVLHVDATYFLNLHSNPNSAPFYGLTNAVDPVCTSVDPGVGIGTGSNQVNSVLCTATTIVAGADITTYTFADGLFFTPVVNRSFGDTAYTQVRARW